MSSVDMVALSSNVHKKKSLMRKTTGHFGIIRCPSCNKERVFYSHSQTEISCKHCSTPLLKPTGGKVSLVDPKSVTKIAENDY